MIRFADRVMESVEDVVRGIRGWTKADHTQYFPLACPHSQNVLALNNGSLMSVIRLDGYMGQYFPKAYDDLVQTWTRFMQTTARDKTASGFDIYWSYEYDPEGMAEKTKSYRQRMIDAAARRGMNVRDILEEEAAVYGSICANETQLILIVSHLDSLQKAERREAMASRQKDFLSAIRGADAISLQAGIKAIDAIHEQHVNKFTSFMESAGRGYTFQRLDCYEALKAMRQSILPDTTSHGWKPRLTMNDCRFRSTESVPVSKKASQNETSPNDWTFALPPPLATQMVPDDVVDLGKYVVVGNRTYAPMYVRELATEPQPMEDLLQVCHKRRIPVRIMYSIMANSEIANYWNTLFASMFTFASTSNRQITKAMQAMKAYKEGAGAVFGYGLAVTTWAETEVAFKKDGSPMYSVKRLQKVAGDLEALLQQWGGQQIDNIFGCSVESVMGATPGYSIPPTCPKAPQIETDILAQLPIMRPATLWEPDNAIWFRTAEGVLSPYQPMSGKQSAMLQLVLGGMGYGKSNLISEVIFYFANHPTASSMPYIRGIDFGASSSGVVDMIRESLPEDKKHEAVFEIFSPSSGLIKNLLDCGAGMKYPLLDHGRFLTTWLMILCDSLIETAGVSNVAAVLDAAIQRAYEIRDPRHQLFESIPYDDRVADPVVKAAVAKAEIELDEHTHYWEVTDALYAFALENHDSQILHAAKVAQRRCAPQFHDLIHACDQIRDQFKNMPEVSGKSLVDTIVNCLSTAHKRFPIFCGVTNTDISESRVCIFDMSEAFGRGTTPFDDWTRSVYFAVVYRLLSEDLFVNKKLSGKEIQDRMAELGLTDALVKHHMDYLEEQDQLMKLFWADEVHRLGRVHGALEILDSMAFEGRKYRVGMMVGSQIAQHLPPQMVKLATSAFIFGVNQSSQMATALGDIFSLSEDECKAITAITKPNAEKGAEVFVVHRVDTGSQNMKLHFQLGAIKRWAYATEAEERTLRGILYKEGSSTGWARKMLASKVGNVKQLIKTKQQALGAELSEQEAIRQIADQLLRMDKQDV